MAAPPPHPTPAPTPSSGPQGGYIRLSLRDVAGSGVTEVALAHCPRDDANDTATAATGSGDTALGACVLVRLRARHKG